MSQTVQSTESQPVILRSAHEVRHWVDRERQQGHRIALVPTMGALHNGHMALVQQGLQQADSVIVSIFVNPTQFGANEDFSTYPRTEKEDLQKLYDAGANAVFLPATQEMYPDNFVTAISIGGISERLEGAHRPGHFDGVATIVCKLLLQVTPDVALFGEKDYQQLQIIKRLVSDLNINTDITGVPIVRDEQGLALSSRNAYLNDAQYNIAIALNKTLFAMAEKINAGEDIQTVKDRSTALLEKAGFDSLDYLEICDAETLCSVIKKTGQSLRILAAVHLGKTRLIDNVSI